MDYRIDVSEDRKYIVIKYFVPMTTEMALKSGPELLKCASENSTEWFLFDMRESKNVQSVTKNYYFAYENIQTFEFPRNSRTAFLVNPSDTSHDFITTAFLNAGYIVKKFENQGDAVEWLTEG